MAESTCAFVSMRLAATFSVCPKNERRASGVPKDLYGNIERSVGNKGKHGNDTE